MHEKSTLNDVHNTLTEGQNPILLIHDLHEAGRELTQKVTCSTENKVYLFFIYLFICFFLFNKITTNELTPVDHKLLLYHSVAPVATLTVTQK